MLRVQNEVRAMTQIKWGVVRGDLFWSDKGWVSTPFQATLWDTELQAEIGLKQFEGSEVVQIELAVYNQRP